MRCDKSGALYCRLVRHLPAWCCWWPAAGPQPAAGPKQHPAASLRQEGVRLSGSRVLSEDSAAAEWTELPPSPSTEAVWWSSISPRSPGACADMHGARSEVVYPLSVLAPSLPLTTLLQFVHLSLELDAASARELHLSPHFFQLQSINSLTLQHLLISLFLGKYVLTRSWLFCFPCVNRNCWASFPAETETLRKHSNKQEQADSVTGAGQPRRCDLRLKR